MSVLTPDDKDQTEPIEPISQGDLTRLAWSVEAGHDIEVIAFKIHADRAIARMQDMRNHSTGDKARWCALAITELEVACMWGTKALTA